MSLLSWTLGDWKQVPSILGDLALVVNWGICSRLVLRDPEQFLNWSPPSGQLVSFQLWELFFSFNRKTNALAFFFFFVHLSNHIACHCKSFGKSGDSTRFTALCLLSLQDNYMWIEIKSVLIRKITFSELKGWTVNFSNNVEPFPCHRHSSALQLMSMNVRRGPPWDRGGALSGGALAYCVWYSGVSL